MVRSVAVILREETVNNLQVDTRPTNSDMDGSI